MQMLEMSPASIVVTDLVMPEMDGLQLLAQVRKWWPDTIRIVLSGRADSASLVKSAGPGHQFLPKPCSLTTLCETIDRMCFQREQVANPELQRIVSQIRSLPSLPALYTELQEELNSASPSIEQVARIAGQDMAMCAKILHSVNVAGFGLFQPIASLPDAVAYLGTDAIKSLVLSALIFAHFETQASAELRPFYAELWGHSIETARCARQIARAQGLTGESLEETYAAGLMHDIGKLILARNLPAQFRQSLAIAKLDKIQPWKAEINVFGVSHATVGAYLLGLWNLPNELVASVASHHTPRDYWKKTFSPLMAVHVADALVHVYKKTGHGAAEDMVDFQFLNQAGLAGCWDDWQAAFTDSQSATCG